MPTPFPKLIIMAGANGAGKSTLAPHLLRDTFGLLEYVNADTIALGLSAFAPETVGLEAGRIMLRRLHTLGEARASFAFETTLATRSYAPWLRKLKTQGYEVHLVYLWLRSPDLAVQRVRERVLMGGHHITEAVVRRRYSRGLENFFALYRPLVNTWALYDTSVLNTPVTIALGEADEVKVVYDEHLWARVKEIR